MDLNNNTENNNNEEKDNDDEMFRTTNLIFWPLLRKIPKEFLDNVKKFQIFHNGKSAIFLHQDGIFVYGDNSNGWFGLSDNHVDQINEYPIQIDRIFDEEIESIQIGSNFILLLTNFGHLYGCGSNSHGQIGLQNVAKVKQFTLIRNRIRFVKIASGSLHALALDIHGNIWTWGDNEFNQCMHLPFKIIRPLKINEFRAIDIACGYTSSTMLNSDRNVYVWGRMASIYFRRPTLIEFQLKPDDFIVKVYGCRDICALQTNNDKILHCFNRNGFLDFQKIKENIHIINTHWNYNHIILYSKSEKKCFVWNYDDPKLLATNSNSISDITNLYIHPNTPGLIKLPLNVFCNTDFNDPNCSDLELITDITDCGELPRTLYVKRDIIMKNCKNLLRYSDQSPTNADRIMVTDYPYSFLFQYLYFIYNGNYQTLWQINQNSIEYFKQTMLLQDLIAHFSLDDQLREELEAIIQKRLNSENYVQIITLMDKYQTHCLPSRSPFYLDINIQNCGKIFEDALHYNQSKFIGRIFHILYDFININYRYLEEKIDPNLCEYYKQELLDDNDELYNLAIRYDTGKKDCISFINDNVVTITLLQIYKSCFMYQRYDLIPDILKRIKFCMRKHFVNIFYFYLFSLNYQSYDGLFNDCNHQYLHNLIVSFTKDPKNFEINWENILDHVLVESHSISNMTYFIKAKLFQLNDDFRWLESAINFSGQETLMLSAIYCQFYSIAKKERDEKMLKIVGQCLSTDLFINTNTLPLIFLLALYYEDEDLKSAINKRLSTNLNEENILIIYKIVQIYIDDEEFIRYLGSLFIKHINIFNYTQLYELIQQHKDSLTLTTLRSKFIEHFDQTNLCRFIELATKFNDEITVSNLEKFILRNLNVKTGIDFYQLVIKNQKSFSKEFIEKFRNSIMISSKNIINFIKLSSSHFDVELEEKMWKSAHVHLTGMNCIEFYELIIQKHFYDQCLQQKIRDIILAAKNVVNFENFERIYKLAIKANDEILMAELGSSIVKRIIDKENCHHLYRIAMINSDDKMLKNIGKHIHHYLTVKNCSKIYELSYKNGDSFVRQQCLRFSTKQLSFPNDKQMN